MALLLNADVGEGLEADISLFPYLDQASIACGGHAGDTQSMRRSVEACIESLVVIGAHPSYPDRENFGRVSMPIDRAALERSLLDQIQALLAVCDAAGAKLSYVKPHGALYNDMMADIATFELLLSVVAQTDGALALMLAATPEVSRYPAVATQAGVNLITEAFADRLYLDNGALSSRSKADAVHQSETLIVEQARRLNTQSQVITATGSKLELRANSLCLHGDNPASVFAAPSVAAAIRA